MAGGFSDGMVIGHRLNCVVLADGLCELLDDVSSLFAKDLLPCVDTVDSDSFSHIVSVQTHSGH